MKTIKRILCVALCAALLAGGGWFLWNRTNTTKATAETAYATTTTLAPAPVVTAEAPATVIVVNATPVPTTAPTAAPTVMPTAVKAEVRRVPESGSQTQAWHLFASSVKEAQEWLNSQDWADLEGMFIATNGGMSFYQSTEVSEAKADGTYVGWWTAEKAVDDAFARTGEVEIYRANGEFVTIPVATSQACIRVNHADTVRGIDDDAANGRFVRQGDGRWVLNDEYASGEAYSTANVLGKLRSVDGFAQAGRLGDSFGLMMVAEGEYRFVLYIAAAPVEVASNGGNGGNGGNTTPTLKPTPAPTPAHESAPTLPPEGQEHSREELKDAPDSNVPPQMGEVTPMPTIPGATAGKPAHAPAATLPPEKEAVSPTATQAPAPTPVPAPTLPAEGQTHTAGDENAAPVMGGITW